MLSRLPRTCIGAANGCFRTSRVSGLQATAIARYYASKSFPPHSIITMPALSPTMTQGNIGSWHKAPGDTLAPGDVLVEIETDKAQMDFEFQEEGVLAKILIQSGEKEVAVGAPIAVLTEEGSDVSQFESFTASDAGGAPKPDASASKEESKPESSDQSSSAIPQGVESDSTGARLQTSLDREPIADPAVRKLAFEKGVSLAKITGSGPGGRILRADVEKVQSGPAGSAAALYEDVPASAMRKVIAARLTESKVKNPHYYVSSSISVSKLQKLRTALNASAAGEYKLSVNDFLVKALAVAARKVPVANSSWREVGGEVVIRQHKTVDVSVAVSTPTGLVTPIVKNVGGAGLKDISLSIKDLGKRARENKLKPEEYQGGSITISNMGMNAAVERFTAVINPPQATIIAVGTVKKVAVPGPVEVPGEEASVVWDDQIVITGSFDHKVVDGAVGAEFMRELKRAIENPLELML